MLLCCETVLWDSTELGYIPHLLPGAAKMTLLAVNARSIRVWGKLGLSRMSLALKLLGSILGNKDVVSAGDKESLQPAVNGVQEWTDQMQSVDMPRWGCWSWSPKSHWYERSCIKAEIALFTGIVIVEPMPLEGTPERPSP